MLGTFVACCGSFYAWSGGVFCLQLDVICLQYDSAAKHLTYVFFGSGSEKKKKTKKKGRNKIVPGLSLDFLEILFMCFFLLHKE